MLFTQSPNTIWTSDRVLYLMPYIADYFVRNFKIPVVITRTTDKTFWFNFFLLFVCMYHSNSRFTHLLTGHRPGNYPASMLFSSCVTVPSPTAYHRKSIRLSLIFFVYVCILCNTVYYIRLVVRLYGPLLFISVIQYHPIVLVALLRFIIVMRSLRTLLLICCVNLYTKCVTTHINNTMCLNLQHITCKSTIIVKLKFINLLLMRKIISVGHSWNLLTFIICKFNYYVGWNLPTYT